MAANVKDTSTTNSGTTEKKRSGLQRLAWILLVGIVPILVLLIVVAVALQVIGVPVWQTTLQFAGVKPKTTTVSSPLSVSSQKLKLAEQQVAQLKSQLGSLQQKMQAQTAQVSNLQQTNQTLLGEVHVQVSLEQNGQAEAKILAQMDPQAAASVLQKMSLTDAGWAVESMSPSVSAPILQVLPPTLASHLISQSATDQSIAAQIANAKQSANSTTNSSAITP